MSTLAYEASARSVDAPLLEGQLSIFRCRATATPIPCMSNTCIRIYTLSMRFEVGGDSGEKEEEEFTRNGNL